MLWIAFANLAKAATADGAGGLDQASDSLNQDPAMFAGSPASNELPAAMPVQSGPDPLSAAGEPEPSMSANAFDDSQTVSLFDDSVTATPSGLQSSAAEVSSGASESLMNDQSEPSASMSGTGSSVASRITASSGAVQTGLATDGPFSSPAFANNTGNMTSAAPNGGRNNTAGLGNGPAPTSSRASSSSAQSTATAPANGGSMASLSKSIALASVLSSMALFM